MDDLDALLTEPWTRARPVRPDVTEGGLAGIPLHRLDYPLVRARQKAPPVKDAAARFYARFPKYVDEYKEERQSVQDWWDKGGWWDVPYKAMAVVFTPDELFRLKWSAPVSNHVEDHFYDRDEEHPLDHVLWKVVHSFRMWGHADRYDQVVDFYRGLRKLSFGEGFEVRLDHTNSINERGTAVHTRFVPPKPVWLDGEFGLIVYYKGKHVLTVGFSATGAGVLIHQVQLREKKGNRFLYKLPKPCLEHAVDCFQAAFGDRMPVLLIDGATAVQKVRAAYGTRKDEFDAKGVADRIREFYDQPLAGYERVEAGRMVYVECRRLVPRAASGVASQAA